MYQINIFEYYQDLIPESKDMNISNLQLKKVYDSFFDLKMFRRSIENMTFYIENGCLGVGIGWSEKNPTIINIDKRGVEFDHDGVFHKFKDVALLLIKNYG